MANGTLNATPGGDRRPWITTLVILLVVFLAVGAYVELRPRRIRISVVKPIRQEVSSSITTNGKVEPVHGFEAHSPLAVTVQKVLVKEGDRVKAGQLLVVLDDTRARSDLAVAQTRLKAAQEKYANLLAGGNQQQILLRQADRQKATTELDSAQRQLSSLERLQQRGAASMDEVVAARDRVARAQADLAQFQSKVRYSPDELSRAQSESRRFQGQHRSRRGATSQLQHPRPVRRYRLLPSGARRCLRRRRRFAFAGSRSFPSAGSRLRR